MPASDAFLARTCARRARWIWPWRIWRNWPGARFEAVGRCHRFMRNP